MLQATISKPAANSELTEHFRLIFWSFLGDGIQNYRRWEAADGRGVEVGGGTVQDGI